MKVIGVRPSFRHIYSHCWPRHVMPVALVFGVVSSWSEGCGHQASIACCAAATGTTTRVTHAYPTAITTPRTTVTTTTGFVSPSSSRVPMDVGSLTRAHSCPRGESFTYAIRLVGSEGRMATFHQAESIILPYRLFSDIPT